MPSATNIRYPIDEAIIASAAACNKGLSCLKAGPKCRVGAILNENTLIVDCLDMDAGCSFYRASNSHKGGSGRGVCQCPVRLALRNKFSL
jgi:hypothetical protein